MKKYITKASFLAAAFLHSCIVYAQEAPDGLRSILQDVNTCENMSTGSVSTVEFSGYDGRRVDWENREIFKARGISNIINGSDYIESIQENSDSYFIKTSISAGREPPVFVEWVVYKPQSRGDRQPMASRSGSILCYRIDYAAEAREPE